MMHSVVQCPVLPAGLLSGPLALAAIDVVQWYMSLSSAHTPVEPAFAVHDVLSLPPFIVRSFTLLIVSARLSLCHVAPVVPSN